MAPTLEPSNQHNPLSTLEPSNQHNPISTLEPSNQHNPISTLEPSNQHNPISTDQPSDSTTTNSNITDSAENKTSVEKPILRLFIGEFSLYTV